jgi:hypothetical protein
MFFRSLGRFVWFFCIVSKALPTIVVGHSNQHDSLLTVNPRQRFGTRTRIAAPKAESAGYSVFRTEAIAFQESELKVGKTITSKLKCNAKVQKHVNC